MNTLSSLRKACSTDWYDPPTQESVNYKHWLAVLDLKTCFACRTRHGTIYLMDEIINKEPPLHPNCRCKIKPMRAVAAGYATKDGQNGADWYLKYLGILPENYISGAEAEQLGWRAGRSPKL